jgi:hypothetical protein
MKDQTVNSKRWMFVLRLLLVIVGAGMIAVSILTAVLHIRNMQFDQAHFAIVVIGICLLIEALALSFRPLLKVFWYSLVLGIVILFVWWILLLGTPGYSFVPVRFDTFNHIVITSAHLFVLFLALVFLVIAIVAIRKIHKNEMPEQTFVQSIKTFFYSGKNKKLFSRILTRTLIVILIIVLVGVVVEVFCSFLTPGWPARDLRPVAVSGGFNSWGLVDSERTIDKPENTSRIIFVGDSFMEGSFSPKGLNSWVQDSLDSIGVKTFECVNLGVSATGPYHYLNRIKSVGEKLSPDTVALFIYEGNDFMYVSLSQQPTLFVRERPLPSILGSFMPRLTWLIVNKFGLSELGGGSSNIPDETATMNAIAAMPYRQGLKALAEHMQKYYYPTMSLEDIEEILGRGGQAFWDALVPNGYDTQYLQGWRVKQIIETGLGNFVTNQPVQINTNMVDATASYIEAISEELKQNNIPLYVFVIPMADNVDIAYQQFWKPWFPDPNDWNFFKAVKANGEALIERLKAEGINITDLTQALDGTSGTYRIFDGHWTTKGHEVVAAIVAKTIAFDLSR